jgi:UDP-N-acetylmuramate dehydrogenase
MQNENIEASLKDFIRLCESESEIVIKKNVLLSDWSYFKIGGRSEVLVYPGSITALEKILRYMKMNGISYQVIGSTTNIVFLGDIASVLVCTKLLDAINLNSNTVTVECGRELADFCRLLYSKSILGFEGLEGIPGTIGGAITMNAGAYGYHISDKLISVKLIDLDGNAVNLEKYELAFERRASMISKNGFTVISATFDISNVTKKPKKEIYNKVSRFHIARHKYQEWVLPNTGSIFSGVDCVYRLLASKNKYAYLTYKLYNLIYRNSISRRLMVNPNRRILNKIYYKIFDIDSLAHIISDKHINTFANSNMTEEDFNRYVIAMGKLYGDKAHLENIVISK